MLRKKYIDITWSSPLAYALGLIVTDGNLSPDKRHMSLRSSDKDLLETFKRCLNLKNKIAQTYHDGYAKKPSYRIQFGDVHFYEWLEKLGLMPAKSHVIGDIHIPQKFFRDFLRGHLDGDGYIQIYRDSYNLYKGKQYINTRIYTRFISASKKHIEWLYVMIKKCAPISKGVILKHKGYKNSVAIWEARFSKYDSLKLLRWMYYSQDIPCLERKRRIANQLLDRLQDNKLIR